jgi:hypothetical protein
VGDNELRGLEELRYYSNHVQYFCCPFGRNFVSLSGKATLLIMRNLKKIKHSTWRSPPEHQERQISATTWDPLGDSIICAYGPSEFDTLIELVRVKELKTEFESPICK